MPELLESSIVKLCGCGKPAPFAKRTNSTFGYTKGQPVRFIPGHNLKNLSGKDSPQWKGGRFLSDGYVMVNVGPKKRRFEHHIVAEKMLGRPLRPEEVVHHKNGKKGDNSPENLEICTQSEHARKHAMCRKPEYLPLEKRCPQCKAVKASSEFSRSKNRADGLSGWCKECYHLNKLGVVK